MVWNLSLSTPYFLATGAIQSITSLIGLNEGGLELDSTISTGDLVSHDPINELSRALTEYSESAVFAMFDEFIPGPFFATLGDHESIQQRKMRHTACLVISARNSPGITTMFQACGNTTAGSVRQLHKKPPPVTEDTVSKVCSLSRIMSLITDFWSSNNLFNFIDTITPDVSGMQAWLITELQAAEDTAERVSTIDHVLTSWGTDCLPNPTDLFYQIIDRYSPHGIADIFFGHSHQNQQ